MWLSVFVHFPLIFLASAVAVKQFRCDYEYIAEVNGWFKFHNLPATWSDARLRCHLEGTTLASPLNYRMRRAIRKVANENGIFGRNIFIGIHSTFSKGDYVSVEGVPLSDISYHWARDEPNNLGGTESCLYLTPIGTIGDTDCNNPRPFVCYKTHVANQNLTECGTIDKEYTYNPHSGSCYKFHTVPRVYSRAFMTCAAEGGYLSIINNQEEANFIKNLFAKYPPSSMVGKFYKDAAYVGFNDWSEHGEWLTTHGETLERAGYDQWAPGEPNNSTAEFCGGVYRTAKLLDIGCDTVHAFICEKNPGSLICD